MSQTYIKFVLPGIIASLLVLNCLNFDAFAQKNSECNLVNNGSFEQGPNPGGFTTLKAGNTSINAWRITQLSVDYIGTYFPSADGKRHLDMTGTPGGGSVVQNIKTMPGKQYTLEFAMAGNPHCAPATKKMMVRAGSASQQFTHGSNLNWKRHTMSFTANASQTPIVFTSIDSPDGLCGALLDDIRVMYSNNANLNDFTGDWNTNWGPMTLKTNGNKLTGYYTHDKGHIEGTISSDGKLSQGWWSESPSYKGPDDAGRFMFQLSSDGKSLSGRWGHGDSLDNGEWTANRVTQEFDCNSITDPEKNEPFGCTPTFSLNRNVPPPVSYNLLSN